MRLIVLAVLLATNLAFAKVGEFHKFNTPEQEATYKTLIAELRCLVCQNQNIADSNAELAQDMRRKTHELIVNQNMDYDQIVDYMVQRYGDFVVYKPPFKASTALLWILPFALLGFGIIALLYNIKQRQQNVASDLSQAQLDEAARLLDEKNNSEDKHD